MTGCCASLQLLLPPSLLPRCPGFTHSQNDKESWALLLPPQCSENALSLQDMSTLSGAAYIFFQPSNCSSLSILSSFLYIFSFSAQPDLCNAISLLAIYERGCYGNYGLHLSLNRSASLTLSLFLSFSPLS